MQSQLLGPLRQPATDILVQSADQLLSRVHSAGNSSTTPRGEELKKVAQEFESLFVAFLLKVMRETIEESGLAEGGLGKGIYADLFDQEIARSVAQHGALGISTLLARHLSAEAGAGAPSDGNIQLPEDKLQCRPPKAAPVPSSGQLPLPELDSEIPDCRLPVRAPVSSGFGLRKDPFTHGLRFHKGMDLAAPSGSGVHAVLGGKVILSDFEPQYGNTVVVQHSGGLQTKYAHLASTSVKTGDIVSPEQLLGSVGSTGHSTGSHLHFEVLRWGEPINPQSAIAD